MLRRLSSEQIRIATNYLRMAVTVLVGLWMVRAFIGVSPGVYAVIALIGTSVGVAGMLQEMVRGAMVPELSFALYRDSEKPFSRTFSSAFVLSFIAACFGAAVMLAFYVLAGTLSIPPELLDATRLLIATRVVVIFGSVLLAPAINLLPVTGHMAAHNGWMTLERLAEALAVVAAFLLAAGEGPAGFLTAFAWLSAGLMLAVNLGWALHGRLRCPDSRFAFSAIDGSIIRKIAGTVGWNGFVVVSFNLYVRFDLFLMNILFGVFGTVVFALANQLVSYTRQISIGLVQGLDAVVAKTTRNAARGADAAMAAVAAMQANVIFASAGFLALCAPDIFEVWVADRLGDAARQLPVIVLIFNIMLVGIVSRALSEGWMKYLSGIGEVRAYGPVLLVGALCNPLLIAVLIGLFPEPSDYLAIPIAFGVLMTLVHLVVLPRVTARHMNQKVAALYRPMLRPLLLAVAAVLAAWIAQQLLAAGPLSRISIAAIVFGAVFAPVLLRIFVAPPAVAPATGDQK